VRPGRRSIFFTAEQHHARLVSVETREGETAGPLIIDLGAIAKGEDPRLELVGIGAVLEAKGDALMIKQALPGGGAAEAGLIAGDGILFIEGESVLKLGFSGGIESIRGPEGTYVKLEIRRVDGTVTSVVVPRRRLER
jgi:C-terminal processing protease CtpA/Prc